MDCPDVRARDLRAGRPPAARPRSVRAHLRGCDDCRALRDAIAARAGRPQAARAAAARGRVGRRCSPSLFGGGGGGSLVAQGGDRR